MVFLTARSAEVDRIVGLEIGGDDYVVKPFSPRELAARAKAVLRRYRAGAEAGADHPPGAAGAPGLEVDRARARITFHGVPLPLSSTEFRLLAALCDQPGRVFSRAQLMELAWEDPDSALERTVDAHVKSLRAKLRAARPGEDDPLVTHRGLGYSARAPEP